MLTNLGIEKALNEFGVELIRTDVGDKFVLEAIERDDLLIGGESSGHVFVFDKLQTGDGILNALQIAKICEKSGKKLSEFFNFETYEQKNINVEVADKIRIVNSVRLSVITEEEEKKLGDNGRIMIHVSSTEPCIRVMVETKDISLSTDLPPNNNAIFFFINH